MAQTFDFKSVLSFLDALAENNQKAWFDQNRAGYQKARAVFESFLNQLIDKFRFSDHLDNLSAKACVARIYRDVRFSKDKSPYKTSLSALIAPGGWKSQRMGYFISIAPQGQTLIAGGLYAPSSEQLRRFRQAVDQDANEIKQIVQERNFREQFGEIAGQRLKTSPRGYDQTHPEIELLQLKQVTAMHTVTDQDLFSEGFFDHAVKVCHAMKPFLDYLDEIV